MAPVGARYRDGLPCYDERAILREADAVEGAELETVLEKMFGDPAVDFAHVHNAKPGCFAVRVDRS